ncbi:hypothetical protein ACMD2_27005 [Ananas comosus]|uniref:Uncharacterized protein n=1 Tax=Ananas comosus TaxID=4615 RepID=A0A199VXT1_ANACO|nr:hypothetical protein ACMD2_27005 [Ananas comosus]
MAAVLFDHIFFFICTGWEGSTADICVLRWACDRGGRGYIASSNLAGVAPTPRRPSPRTATASERRRAAEPRLSQACGFFPALPSVEITPATLPGAPATPARRCRRPCWPPPHLLSPAAAPGLLGPSRPGSSTPAPSSPGTAPAASTTASGTPSPGWKGRRRRPEPWASPPRSANRA